MADDLLSRLQQYDSLLLRKIKEEEKAMIEESIIGSIAASNRLKVYQDVQQDLYQKIPELKK